MKMLIVALSLAITTIASAASVKVLDIPTWGYKTAVGEFGWNEELNRVWVEIEVSDVNNGGDGYTPDYYRTKVEGLEFDTTSRTAVLTVDGQAFECAAVKQRGILVFRHNYLKQTGCKFISKVVTELEDDGFEIKKVQKLQVFLITK